MRIKQSVCIPMVKPESIPLAEFVSRVAEMGYVAVEIWSKDQHFETLVGLARQHHLVIASMVGHDMSKGGFNDPTRHADIEMVLRQSIDVAAENGIPGLICFSGNRRPGLSDEQGIENSIQGLRRIAPYAEKKGVNLNLEFLNSKVDHAGYQFDHFNWGKEVVTRVASPRVKLLYDIYHAQIMEGDIIRTICDNIGLIGHFHTAGVPGRHEIDETQELNYGAISCAIAATPYDLYMGHEFSSTGDVYAALQKAYTLCDQAA